jgi:thiamine biosynthesis protein ThiI
VLVRYSGELTTKAAPTRRRFVQRLADNLRDALKSAGYEGKIQREHDRLFIELQGEGELEALSRVFGIQSLALVEPHDWDTLEDLVAIGLSRFREAVRDKRFAVRVRRVGDRGRIAVGRVELERALGAALSPLAAGVDLGNPEVSVRIEVMEGRAYFFTDSLAGRGGLPLGVEGRAVALVSGGFDSAVAAWQLMKRGVALDFVFCNLGGRSHQLEAMRVMKWVADRWCYGTRPRFHAIDFDAVSRDLQDHSSTRYWQVILKRLMLRAGEQVARQRHAPALITGDAVGQVSSQTLQNIAVISGATSLPILRPLVGLNKDEILAVAREIGTYELSSQVEEYCALVPRKPATHAKREVIEFEEQRLDASLLEQAVAERSVFDLRSLDLAVFDAPELEADSIPEAAVVLDLRSKAAFQAWHYPEALYLEFSAALRAYPEFRRDAPYVLYCEFGLKSAHLAELMRSEGFEASHFMGGLKQLLQYARESGIPTPEL